jgi:hypothetical protein
MNHQIDPQSAASHRTITDQPAGYYQAKVWEVNPESMLAMISCASARLSGYIPGPTCWQSSGH